MLKKAALFIATLGSFLTPFISASINVALPTIAQEYRMDALLMSWVATAFLLSAAIFLVPFGKIADIYGRKRIFAYGIGIYTLASFLSILAPSALFLIGVRVVQGIGAAMLFGTGTAILTSVFPPGERGRALGINIATVYLGLSLGPFLGGLLTQNFGWRSIFIVNVILGVIILILIQWLLKGEWAEAQGERFDFSGAIIYGLMLFALMYGFSRLPDPSGALLILVGLLLLAVFIAWEKRVRNPILNMLLFRGNLVFALSNLAALINYSATFAVGFLLSLYLQYIKGFPPQAAGTILVAQPVVQALFSPIAGRLSDKIESRVIASLGMALSCLGLVLLATLEQNTPLPFIVISLGVLGFGFALFSSPNTNAIMSSVERKFYGVASATLGTMRLMGQMFSIGTAMLIFAVFIGRVEITPAYYPAFVTSIKTAFAVFAVLCFGGIFASLARGRLRQEKPRPADVEISRDR